MNHSKVILTCLSEPTQNQEMIHVPQSVMQKLHIPAEHPIALQMFDSMRNIFCLPIHTKSNTVLVHHALANQLGFPDQSRVKLIFNRNSNQLCFGPVLAILISNISRSHPPCAKLNSFCEELIVYARSRHIFAYVTTIDELLSAEKTLHGWVFIKNRWVEQKCPFPHVVYNRVGTRRAENTAQFKTLKEILEKRKTRMFNQTFLNKWGVYQQLRKDQKLNPFLPQTHMFDRQALKRMLATYSTVFIKPINGSMGRGIYRISRKHGRFLLQYTTTGGQTLKEFKRRNELYNYLSTRVNPQNHIIQQGIHLLQMNERTVDFRALMQKNAKGQWKITSMVARVGPVNRFISNVSSGGEIHRVMNVLRDCAVPSPKKTCKLLESVAKKSCAAIEEKYRDQFGELGVDLGLTPRGHIYVLEINSKPSKTEDTLPNVSHKARPSVHRLLDYTQFLTYLAIK